MEKIADLSEIEPTIISEPTEKISLHILLF